MTCMIKIKVAILDEEDGYLKRITEFFGSQYGDRLESYAFTNQTALFSFLHNHKVDVLLASDRCELDVKSINEKMAFAYLVNSTSIQKVNDKRAICKYQKADLFYKDILALYSENPANVIGLRSDREGETMFLAVFSAAGGNGASTIAAACCMNLASRGKRVLYLNLESMTSSRTYFQSDGNFSISDIVFAIKSKKGNLSLRIESSVKEDSSGVFFFDDGKTPLDVSELTTDDIVVLFDELRFSKSFDYVLIDAPLQFQGKFFEVMRYAHTILLVTDGSLVANSKLQRIHEAIAIVEQRENVSLLNKIFLVGNKFENGTSRMPEMPEMPEILMNVRKYERSESLQVARLIANMLELNKLK